MSERRWYCSVCNEGYRQCTCEPQSQDVTRQVNLADDLQHLIEVYGVASVRAAVSQDVAPKPAGASKSFRYDGGGERSTQPGDSELAAIQTRSKHGVLDCALSDRDALLRTVDELTEQRDRAQRVAMDGIRSSGVAQIQLLERTKERDELRAKLIRWQNDAIELDLKNRGLEAKLSESEAAWRTWNTNMSIEASKWEQKCGELEEKRAEAEIQALIDADERISLQKCNRRHYWSYRHWKAAAKIFWARWSQANVGELDQRERAEAAEARVRELEQAKKVASENHESLLRRVRNGVQDDCPNDCLCPEHR